MLLNESIDLCVNRFLEHLSGSFPYELVERAPIVELLPKSEHFGIGSLVHWRRASVCFSLGHGVSLCPRWAAEVG
jgi:hypothetical protein